MMGSKTVAHIEVQITDKEGREVKTEEKNITFKIEGDAKLPGVDNGRNKSIQDYQSDKVTTHSGRCLAIIQSKKSSDKVKVTASCNGLESKTVEIDVR